MNKFYVLLIAFLLISTTETFSQNYKYGKVSKEELQETFNPKDSSANATILYEKKRIRFQYNKDTGFELITEVHKRIKLYNKNGFEYASDEVFLYKSRGNDEKISGLNGKTYSLLGGKIIQTKLKKEGIFKTEDSDYSNKVAFTMPALQEGSVIEYKYKIISPFVRSIDRIHLQYEIPIKKIDISLTIPEYYNFKKRTVGFLPINFKESSVNDKITIIGNYRTDEGASVNTQTEFYRNEIDFVATKYEIKTDNVPAFKKEPFSGNPLNYLSGVIFELETTNFPNSTIKNYGTTWGAIARGAYKNSNFGGEIKKTSYFKDDIDKLIAGVSDPLKKISLIYEFVKQKMTWNERYALTPRDGLKKSYKEGVGNCADINLMLIGMLKYAKIAAKPVLVTSSNKPLSLFPTIQGLDYVVARVRLDDKILYLDATDKYGEPNVLPNRVIKGLGRLIAESGDSEMVFFRPSEVSKKKSSVLIEIDNEGYLKGKQRITHFLYDAHDFRTRYGDHKTENHTNRLKNAYGLESVSDYKVNNIENLGKTITESFEFEAKDEVELIDDELFFSPLLFLRQKENIFKADDRQYSVDLGYGFSNEYSVNIKIPEGYQVIETPENKAFQLPENMGSFVFQINVTANMIQIKTKETVSTPLIVATYYPALKEFYNQLIKKENEQIVLKKV